MVEKKKKKKHTKANTPKELSKVKPSPKMAALSGGGKKKKKKKLQGEG